MEPKWKASWLDTLRLLADPTRLRLLAALRKDSLAVAEIQEILNMGQSRISTHLAQLRKGGLLSDRREGKKIFYRWNDGVEGRVEALIESTLANAGLGRELQRDRNQLGAVLKRRKEASERYFNAVAGRAGRQYCPGRSWKALAHVFLEIPPGAVVADLGAGEGMVSQVLARTAARVIAVDLSPKMAAFGRQQAGKAGLENLEFREGDIEAPPVEAGSVDVALFSQALHHAANPERAIQAARGILKDGGRLFVLDLKQHHFDAARELYSDLWLGFRETDLAGWMKRAGFREVRIEVVDREEKPPNFQSLLAAGRAGAGA